MKARSWLAAIALSASALFASPLWADNYKVDPVHSSATFWIGHINTSRVNGRFDEVEGTFTLDAADLTKNSFAVTIPVAKIDTNNAKRDGHLKSPDFFNAVEFKDITFMSTKVDKVDDTHFSVTGDLAMHGVTKSITIPVEKVGESDTKMMGQRAGVEATFTIKRSDFGMNTMQGPVGDEVKLVVDLEGAKQ